MVLNIAVSLVIDMPVNYFAWLLVDLWQWRSTLQGDRYLLHGVSRRNKRCHEHLTPCEARSWRLTKGRLVLNILFFCLSTNGRTNVHMPTTKYLNESETTYICTSKLVFLFLHLVFHRIHAFNSKGFTMSRWSRPTQCEPMELNSPSTNCTYTFCTQYTQFIAFDASFFFGND